MAKNSIVGKNYILSLQLFHVVQLIGHVQGSTMSPHTRYFVVAQLHEIVNYCFNLFVLPLVCSCYILCSF